MHGVLEGSKTSSCASLERSKMVFLYFSLLITNYGGLVATMHGGPHVGPLPWWAYVRCAHVAQVEGAYEITLRRS